MSRYLSPSTKKKVLADPPRQRFRTYDDGIIDRVSIFLAMYRMLRWRLNTITIQDEGFRNVSRYLSSSTERSVGKEAVNQKSYQVMTHNYSDCDIRSMSHICLSDSRNFQFSLGQNS